MSGTVAVRVLGPFDVSVDGRAVSLPQGRLQVLLAVLAMSAGRPVGPDRVVDAVWGTELPADPRRTLRTYLARLRRTLGTDTIENGPSGPVLRTAPDNVDALRFLRLADRAVDDPATERTGLVEALALWRGDAFDGLDSPWLHGAEAVRLTERRMAALERRIELDLAAERYGPLVAELRELATAYPLREPLWARLLVALTQSGRQAEALEQYETIRVRIADELGADPGPELRRIHAELLAVGPTQARPTPPAEPVVPRQLPADLGRFTGRAEALDLLTDLLADGGDRAVIAVITGAGGVGKTSLAVRWAHQVADRFPDGVLYLNLRGFGPTTPVAAAAAALDAMLRGLGLSGQKMPSDVDSRGSLLRSMLADRRVLIVLDNARNADQVRPLLPGAGPSLVLVTSRSQLRGLVAREGARRVSLDVLAPAESMRLLASTLDAQRVSHDEAALATLATTLDAARVAHDEPALATLAEQCGHLPLALAIAAERAGRQPDLGLGELVDELREKQDRLAVLDAGEDEATDLRAVFAWSYEALDDDTARVFRRLGLHPTADFGVPAATALTGASEARTRRLLDQLLEANLIQRRGPGRYGLHDLIREYAAELVNRVESTEEREALFDQYVEWWVHTAANARRALNVTPPLLDVDPPSDAVGPLSFDDYGQAFAWFELEQPALFPIAEAAMSHGRRHATYQLAYMSAYYLIQTRRLDDLLGLLHLGLDAARDDDSRAAESMMEILLGTGYGDLGQHDRSRAHRERALAGFESVGHERGQHAALNNLGYYAFFEGRFDAAAEYCERSREIARRIGEPLDEVLPLNILGNAYLELGRLDDAVTACRTALEVAERHGHDSSTASVLDTLGKALAAQDRHDAAIDCLHRSAALFAELQIRWSESAVLTNLGRAYRAIGRVEQATRCWDQALTIFDEIGGPEGPELSRSELVALLDSATRAREDG